MQYGYDNYPSYPSPEMTYDQHYPYEQDHHREQQYRQEYDDPHHLQQHNNHQPHQQHPQYSQQQLQSDFERNASIRSPYMDRSNMNLTHPEANAGPRSSMIEAQIMQTAHLASLPHVDLPPYELPPPYIPKSERRVHENYRSNVQTFRNRSVTLHRNKPSDPLGFSIRGGAEYKCGVFISKVQPRTNAHRAGLQEGDQILFANEESFLNVESHEAMKCLKKERKEAGLTMTVKYFPYAYEKSYDKCKTTPSSG